MAIALCCLIFGEFGIRDFGMSKLRQDDADYSEEETERRMNAALKRALNTPHKPHEPLGKKKLKPKRIGSPNKTSV